MCRSPASLVEGGLYDHVQPYIRVVLMMRVFSRVCSGDRGALGTRGSVVSGSGRSDCFFFG